MAERWKKFKKPLEEKWAEFDHWYKKLKRRDKIFHLQFNYKRCARPDWRDEAIDRHGPRVRLFGRKSIFKWKNFKRLFQKKEREWWDRLPPKVSPPKYRVLYLDAWPKTFPYKPEEPEEPEELEEPGEHVTCNNQRKRADITLMKPMIIDLHAVICQPFCSGDEEAGPSGEDERFAAAEDDKDNEDEEYFLAEE